MGMKLEFSAPEKISIVCGKVDNFGEELQSMIDSMIETLLATPNGVGLAAPQVGYDRAVAVIRPYLRDSKRRYETYVLVNPTMDIKPWTQTIFQEEGCLTFPGRFEQIGRAKSITLTAMDRFGVSSTQKVHGYLARIIQHEIDHLNGITCFSKADKFKKK